MNSTQLKKLLKQVQTGKLTIQDALLQLRTLPYEDIGFASIDHHRSLRQGFPEVIFCEGKSKTQITDIARKLLKKGNPLLATRATPEIARALRRGVSAEELRSIAVEHGMTTMTTHGIYRAAVGETSITEVMRVAGN